MAWEWHEWRADSRTARPHWQLLLFSLSGLAGLSGGNTGALCVLLVLFGLASVPLTYCLHFLYQDEMEAMQVPRPRPLPRALHCVCVLAVLLPLVCSAIQLQRTVTISPCAMQGINTLLTSVGVLGFLVVWILDSIYQLFMFPNVLK